MQFRIKELRTSLGLTQQRFADRLGLKRQTIASYEIGNITPSDSTILLICKEFNISEEWLRTGTGEMYNIQTDDYSNISVDIDKNDPKARQAIIDYWNLSEEDKVLFWKFIDRFVKKQFFKYEKEEPFSSSKVFGFICKKQSKTTMLSQKYKSLSRCLSHQYFLSFRPLFPCIDLASFLLLQHRGFLFLFSYSYTP